MNLTFSARLTGNSRKLLELDRIYGQVQNMSTFMFNTFDWSDKDNNKFSKSVYAEIREKFRSVNSKLVQKAMKEYGKFGKAKLPKKPVTIPLIFDSQNFNLKFENGYYNLFVKFLKLKFPIEGIRTIDKIKDKKVKQVSIKKFNNEYRIYFVCEVEVPRKRDSGKTLGLDLNIKDQVLSNGKFFHTKELEHRKIEYRKCKGKKNIDSFTKNYVHNVVNKIVDYLVLQGVKVLRLEELTDLRKDNVTWNRTRNYKVNNCFPYNMIRDFLSYKCELAGISVEAVNPAHTSDTCYKCGSRDTERYPRNTLICYNSDCLNMIHSDLNGARNIANGKPLAMGQRLTRPSAVGDLFGTLSSEKIIC